MPRVATSRPRVAGVVAAVTVLAGSLAGCSISDDTSGPGIHVVTSFYPLQYIAQRVAGSRVHVLNLTHPGQEPHDLELTVRQTADVESSDVVFYEKGFQAAVDQAVAQSGPAHVVDVADVVHIDGDDPHFWQDPTLLSRVAGAFEKQLADVDPAHASSYARNLRSLQHDLAALDRSYRAGLAHCAITTIVVSHDAFGYLGRRYGLKVVGINGLSPDAEPSAAHIRQLHDLITSDKISTVFSEQLGSRQLADSLAGDLGISTEVLDPIEGLSRATADQDYLSLMRRNLARLERADRCT